MSILEKSENSKIGKFLWHARDFRAKVESPAAAVGIR
jgi:hypothetical protein